MDYGLSKRLTRTAFETPYLLVHLSIVSPRHEKAAGQRRRPYIPKCRFLHLIEHHVEQGSTSFQDMSQLTLKCSVKAARYTVFGARVVA